MTDDLVKRLRCYADLDDGVFYPWVYGEAADRIEKLEKYQSVHAQCDKTSLELEEKLVKQLSEARKRIQMLEAALRVYAEEDHWSGDTFEPIMFPEGECKCCYEHFSDQGEIARKALEGKDG
jgi:hypothetical protein